MFRVCLIVITLATHCFPLEAAQSSRSDVCDTPGQTEQEEDLTNFVQRSFKARAPLALEAPLVTCEAPFTLCALATCTVMNELAVCNCTYMGVNASATAGYTSKGAAQWTNEPTNGTCEYMKQLPLKGKVLSTYTGAQIPPNWPYTLEQTSYDVCDTNKTITAQCDGGICEVMDEAGRPKVDPETWSYGDLSVCSCPLTKNVANQTIVGGGTITVGEDGKKQCKASNSYCMPGLESKDPLGTYAVLVGAPAGVPEALNVLIEAKYGLPPVIPAENRCSVK